MSVVSSDAFEIDISKSNAPLHIKFALVCLDKPTLPKWLGYLCFILSHIQAFALIIKSTYIALPDDSPSSSPVIKLFVKFFAVGDWLTHDNTAPLLVGTLIITAYTLKILSLMLYVHYCLFLKQRIPDFIQNYWGVVHSLHPLLLFFWIHTFCVEILKYSHDYDFSRPVEVFMIVMAYFNTTVNCTLAVFFSTISVVYKTKDVMSSKTNILETQSIVFKIIIPSLWRVASKNGGIQIFILILAVLNAIVKDWHFIRYLPYYKIRVLLFSSVLQAFQSSLSLVSFIVKLVELNRTKNDIGILSVQIIWLLTLPIFAKLYYTFTWKILRYLNACEIKHEKNVYYLVHKRFIMLYCLKTRRIINAGVNRFSIQDILYQARLANVVRNCEIPFEELDVDKKLLARSLKMICIEILKAYPRALLAQINLANSYSNFEDLYLVSNNLLEDAISKKPGYQAQISLYTIRLELQKKLKLQFSEKTGEGLNVSNYIATQELHEQVKCNIEKQAQLQLSFWTEFMSSKSNMMNLANIALKVNNQKRIVRRLWNHLLKIRSPSFLSPLLVFGMYSSLINNDLIAGEKYVEQSREDAKRMKRVLKADELNNDTIFSDKTVKITMSGLRSNLGRIIDCSHNIASFYGWQSHEIKGRPIAALMPPFYRQKHDGFLLDHFNTGKTKILNKTLVIPVKRANGYIHPSRLHAKVSPLMDNGMFYVGLLRPCKSSQRMVLIKKDGKIDDMSLEFARDMNLSGKEDQIECDIFTLCPKFRHINDAFNVMAENTILQASLQGSSPRRKRASDDMIINTFHSALSKRDNYQLKTRDHLLLSERSLIQGETATRVTERPILNGNQLYIKIDTSHLKTGPDEETPRENPNIPRMESNHAQKIYDSFLAGSTLVFYPRARRDEPITYQVKISNSIHGKDAIKCVLLEKVSGGEGTTEDNLNSVQSSYQEDVFSSLPIMNDDLAVKRRSSPNIYAQTLGSFWDTEGADLMSVSPSVRVKTTDRRLIPEQTKDETHLSVGDEVQNDDTSARKAVFRNIIIKDNTPKRLTQGPVFFTEPNETGDLFTKRKRKMQTHVLERPVVTHHHEKEIQHHRRIKLDINVGVNVPEIENSVTSSYASKGKKIEQLVVRALKGEPKKKSSTIFMALSILFLISMIFFLTVQNVNLYLGIKDVQNQIPVIGAGFFRQINTISSSTQVRILKSVLQGDISAGGWDYDNGLFGSYLAEYLAWIKQYNSKFYGLLGKLPTNIQEVFYEKNVGFYEYSPDYKNKTLFSMDSTSEAFQTMIGREFRILHFDRPSQFEEGLDTSNHKFILDNILNDLLIQSQNQMDFLSANLEDSTNSTTLKMGLTLGGVLIVCLIFSIVAIRYLWVLGSEARIFMTMVFRIKPHECEAIQTILQHFISALDMNMKSREFTLSEKAKLDNNSNDNNNASIRFRTASMGSFYKSQRVAFFRLLPIYCVFICWSIAYFFFTSDFIGNIQDSEKRMEASLQALSNQTLLVHELVSIPLSNMTAIVKNNPLRPMLLQSFHYLEQLTSFVDHFKNKDGGLTPLQQSVLYNFGCEDFLPYLEESYNDYKYAYESCFVIIKGKASVGVVDINSQLYSLGIELLRIYDASSKTQAELAALFLLGLQSVNDLISVAEGLLRLLYKATYESFENEVDTVKTNTMYLTISVVFGTVIATLMTWYLALRRIFKIQKIDWFILQIIPIKLILSNKHIQQYLLRHSGGMLDGVKNFL